jgi:hypothetical protein
MSERTVGLLLLLLLLWEVAGYMPVSAAPPPSHTGVLASARRLRRASGEGRLVAQIYFPDSQTPSVR